MRHNSKSQSSARKTRNGRSQSSSARTGGARSKSASMKLSGQKRRRTAGKEADASDFTLQPAPKDAPVPQPRMSQLPAKKLKGAATRRSERIVRLRWNETSRNRAKLWLKVTPSFVMSDADLAQMEMLPKNRPEDVERAKQTMEKMASQDADACSGRWYDRSGRLMVAVFADHLDPNGVSTQRNDRRPANNVGAQRASQHNSQVSSETNAAFQQYSILGRTESDVREAEQTGFSRVMHFGLTPTQQDRVQVATQFLHSVLRPVVHKQGVRHPQENVMRYGREDAPAASGSGEDAPASAGDVPDDESVLTPLPSEYGDEDQHKPLDIDEIKGSVENLRRYLEVMQPVREVELQHDFVRPGVQDEEQIDEYSYERTGVSHLVHSWHAQGHERPTDPLIPSMDMCRGSYSALAVRWYFRATAEVAQLLSAYFAIAFPAEYKKYRQAFEAGVWLAEDPGPWLGRAIVYKLQIHHHQDKNDGGPTAIFNVGQYTGGILYLTSLGLKFLYKPGDIIIFIAGVLYHGVGKAGDKSTAGLELQQNLRKDATLSYGGKVVEMSNNAGPGQLNEILSGTELSAAMSCTRTSLPHRRPESLLSVVNISLIDKDELGLNLLSAPDHTADS